MQKKQSKSFSYINIGEYMKIEKLDQKSYKIFINNLYLKDVDFSDKENMVQSIKSIIKKLRLRLGLRGFYKVKVFPNSKIGVFLEIIQLEDIDFSNNLDLRVILFNDEQFLFETDDYFLIDQCSDVKYYDGKFYCFIDDDFDEILEKVEFGRVLYGKEVLSVLDRCISL